jgi:hypothetical protein
VVLPGPFWMVTVSRPPGATDAGEAMIVGVPAAAIGAKHCTILLVPAQFHDQGPAPLMAEAEAAD